MTTRLVPMLVALEVDDGVSDERAAEELEAVCCWALDDGVWPGGRRPLGVGHVRRVAWAVPMPLRPGFELNLEAPGADGVGHDHRTPQVTH